MAPVTWGQAMDVPDMVVVAVSEVALAARTELPGANRSTHVPQLLKLERLSDEVVDPTVTACAADAGDLLHASPLLLPAATDTTTPF